MKREKQALAELLKNEVERLVAEARTTHNAPAHDAIVRLADLESLIDVRQRLRRRQSRPWIVGASAVLLLGILYLSAKRQREAEFLATMQAPTVHLTVPAGIDFDPLRSLSTRLAGFTLEDGTDTDSANNDPPTPESLPGTTVLQSFVSARPADISLTREPGDNLLHLHIECQSATLCSGAHLVAITGISDDTNTSGKPQLSPRAIRLYVAGSTADISMRIADSLPQIVLSDAEIQEVSFLDVRETPAAVGRRRATWSGVQGGTIKMLATDRDVALAEGDRVSINGSPLRLNRLVARDSGLTVLMRGEASVLETAEGRYVQNLKPTLMEAFVAAYQRKIQVAWAILSLGILLALRALSFFLGER